MNFDIIPNEGAGKLRFGMTKTKIRSLYKCKVSEVQKSFKSKPAWDLLDAIGVSVSYDKNKKCDAIEFFGKSNPLHNGQELLNKPFNQILKVIKKYDKDVLIEVDGFTSFELGIAFYCPNLKSSKKSIIETVFVFKNGYYNDTDEIDWEKELGTAPLPDDIQAFFNE